MQPPLIALAGRREWRDRPWRWAIVAAVTVALVAAQRAVSATPIDAVSPWVPLARLFDLGLTLLVLALAHGVGARLLRRAGLVADPAEGFALATSLGLGVIACALLGLGFAGLYRPPMLVGGLLLLAVAQWRDLLATGRGVAAVGRWARRRAGEGDRLARGLVPLLLASLGLATFAALAPPHHHDPLTYHLALPQHFLRTGAVGPVAEIGPSNVPLAVELLFGLGLAFGSEAFAQLLHLAFAVITAVAIWAMARRAFGQRTATTTLAIFCGTPLVPIWARVANNDLTVGCFVLVAMLAALRARPQGVAGGASPPTYRWLVLAGGFAGLALATKYQALFAVAPLGGLILLDGLAGGAGHAARLRRAALGLGAFGAATAAVAFPWYVQNLPTLLGVIGPVLHRHLGIGPAPADGRAAALSQQYIQLVDGMILSPRTPLGYLLLPLRAFVRGDFEQRYVVPNPLFLTLPLVALVPGWWRERTLRYCLVVSGGFLVAWSLGVQELRYLLAVCGPLALATAYGLRAIWTRRAGRALARGLLLVAALWTLVLVFLHVGGDRPVGVTLGLESRDAYLRQNPAFGATYRATTFLAGRARDGERALFIHELQIYYLPPTLAARTYDARAILANLSEDYPAPPDALAYLRREGITYVYVNEGDIRWWQQGDPAGRIARAKASFDLLAAGLEIVYRDGPENRPKVVIYRVPAAGAAGGR